MKVSTMFSTKKPVISFEIFPPKPEYPIHTIYDTLEGLKSLNPAFVSITYGAGGSNSSTTFQIAEKVKNDYHMATVSHFTCIGNTRAQVDHALQQLKQIGVENILALRGDYPAGQSQENRPSDYRYAKDLISHIRQDPAFSIGAAAYPEGHIECRDRQLNIEHVKQKASAGADFFITQLFFDNAIYYTFLEDVRKAGVHLPISVGIMPITNGSLVRRICSLCGATIVPALQAILEKYEANPIDMEKAGIEYACNQIRDLIDHQVDGIHLYTMNKYTYARTIMDNLGLNC